MLLEIETKYIVVEQHRKDGRVFIRKNPTRICHFQCDKCGGRFQRPYGRVLALYRNNHHQHFCSECPSYEINFQIQYKLCDKRENHSRNEGEKALNDKGYVNIYTRKHQFPRKNGIILEHVMVMENCLGRKLLKDEVVHHIDGNKTNNDPKNLIVMTTEQHIKCHASVHVLVYELIKLGLVEHDYDNGVYRLKT